MMQPSGSLAVKCPWQRTQCSWVFAELACSLPEAEVVLVDLLFNGTAPGAGA